MKAHFIQLIVLGTLFFSTLNISAQGVHPVSGEPLKYCGQAEATEEIHKQYPTLKQAFELIEKQQSDKIINPGITEPLPPVYTIPVVFHILHNYGPENIPDANIHDAIRVLNEDFRRLNADTSSVATAFKGIIGDAEIEFKLAKLDPAGNCTNGIDRIATPKTYSAGDGQNGSNFSKVNMWPREKYLNVYTVYNIKAGAAGYTYLPGSVPANIDGIIIRYDYVGSLAPSSVTTSRSLGHEVGHWLNLMHTWGTGNSPGLTCGNDGVSDTPTTKGWTNCNLTNNDVCVNGVPENVQNYMDYSYCYRMFTAGQCTRMRTALQSTTAQRNNLWSTANLTATGVNSADQLCVADFNVSKKIICVGTAITFTDISGSAAPTSWQWDFNNDGNTDATTQNPSYTYTAAGTYSVSLTVSDGATTKTITKPTLVSVLASGPSATFPYSEGFESASFPYSDFYVSSASSDTATWNRTTAAAYTGSASLKLNNRSPIGGDIDEFITPSIDLSTSTNPGIAFQIAYQRRSYSDTLDRLRILSSTNCGGAWIQRYTKSFSNLPTVLAPSSTSFVPSSYTQWRQEIIKLSSSAGVAEMRFRFEFTGHGVGNNLYIDDINIMDAVSVEEEFVNGFQLNVFPNPFSEKTSVSFNLLGKYQVAIGLYDVIGKEIISISNSTELGPGSYSLPLGKNELKPGVYFVRLEVDGYFAVKKMIVQ